MARIMNIHRKMRSITEALGQPSVTMLVDSKTGKPFTVKGKIYISPCNDDDDSVTLFNRDMYNDYKDVKFKSVTLSNSKLKDFDGDICDFLSKDSSGRVVVVKDDGDFDKLRNIINTGDPNKFMARVNRSESLEKRIARLESLLNESEKERTDVIVKVGNKWRIKGRKVKYWDAEYDTKADAESALKAYWANKHECKNNRNCKLTLEGFTSDTGKDLLRNVQHFLIRIFGHTLYFDHYTDKSVELFYKGDLVAELLYDDKTDEVVVMPNDPDVAPVSFYDTSEYEIQDYLSDLILGDI